MASAWCSHGPQQAGWSAIVLTCQDKTSADAYRKELEIRQHAGLIDKNTLILTIEDPKARVGSGGAMLNALLVVTEYLSAKEGSTTLDDSVIEKNRILIMNVGRDYPFSTCGPVFTTLPAKHYSSNNSLVSLPNCLVTNFDCLLYYLTNCICKGSPNGVWVCSTDMMLSMPSETEIKWSNISQDVVLVVFESSVENAQHHGVCQLDDQGNVKNIIYRGSEVEIKDCAFDNGKVPLVGSIVFFSTKAANQLLTLHTYPPLDACTYYGLDNGAKPIQISLFFDLLLSMASSITESDYVSGKPSCSYGKSTRTGVKKMSDDENQFMTGARKTLWKNLREMKAHGVVMKERCKYNYMHQVGVCYRVQMSKCLSKFLEDANLPYQASNHVHVSVVDNSQMIDDEAIVINSVIKGSVKVNKNEQSEQSERGIMNTVITHSYLQGGITVEPGCILSGIGPNDLKDVTNFLPKLHCLLGYNVSLSDVSSNPHKVFVVFGVNDHLDKQVSSGSFCNNSWEDFFKRTGIAEDDLWLNGMPEDKRTLLNARLFPVIHPFTDKHMSSLSDCLWLAGVNTQYSKETMLRRWHTSWRLSFKEIMSCVDPGTEFHWRRQLFFEIGRHQVEAALKGGTNTCFLPFLKTCALEGFHEEILASMDEIASKNTSMGVAGRTLACIADVLGAMAGEKAGLRSGPAQNVAWKDAFQLLENKKIEEGVKAMALERSKWMDRPDLLIRAARHYEGAEQILRRHAVMTAQQFMDFKEIDPPPLNQWVISEAPVRIDFSGGWTDTPPIAYEHGGVVTNVAIKLNGEKPLQVKAKRITELHIVLVILAGDHSVRVVCEKSNDMADYSQPHAPGALVKACFCAAKLVDLSSAQPLADQLKQQYGCGFEIHSMVDLPYGSGLGTSSILAGVVMAAVLRAAGRTADVTTLVHAVMVVEQMLTCGGGWQDNVGGLAPGFKIARSRSTLPIKVEYQKLEVSNSFVEELSKCLVFVYTGKTRLAKNLLQNVVRNWYGREPSIVKVVDDLASNAEDIAKAIVDGNLARFGQCVSNYREQKRLIAPGTEPEMIRRMMEVVQPHAYGQCLAGAGGGGFLCVISKSADDASTVKDILRSQFPDEVEFYEVSIDNEGLTVRVEES